MPDEAYEAVRDLIRARRSAKEDATGAKQTVKSFLLRLDRRFAGRAAWTKMYWRWLSEQRFDFPHQQLAFEEMQKHVLEAQARVGRLEAALSAAVAGWRSAPLVRNLQALRGIQLVSAATLVAEIGDLHPLRQSQAADGLCRAGAVGAFQRCPDAARPHYPRC